MWTNTADPDQTTPRGWLISLGRSKSWPVCWRSNSSDSLIDWHPVMVNLRAQREILFVFCLTSRSNLKKCQNELSYVIRKPFFRVSDQVQHKPGFTATRWLEA